MLSIIQVCVLKEALRKYSLVPVVTRNAVEEDQLGTLTVPAGTKIFINMKVPKSIMMRHLLAILIHCCL